MSRREHFIEALKEVIERLSKGLDRDFEQVDSATIEEMHYDLTEINDKYGF